MSILIVLNIIIHIIVIPIPNSFEKKLKYWNKFYGKEEERRGRGGEERLKRKKRERESRKKVKTNPIPQKREREREREKGDVS